MAALGVVTPTAARAMEGACEVAPPTKAQFLSQTYTRLNYVPSVQLGAFDLTVNGNAHRAEVLIRVYLAPKDPNSQLQLTKFGKEFVKLVPEVWNKKARFVRADPNWADAYLEPQFRVEVVGLANAHFRIQVFDEDAADHADGPIAMVTEKTFAGLGANPAFAPREGEFGAAATVRGEISSYRKNIIFDLSKSPLQIPIKQSPAQDAAGRQRLEKFAREIMALKVRRFSKSSRRPTLTVNGCGPGNRQTMAQAVATYLRNLGVKNPITESGNGPIGNPDGVLLSFDNNELKQLFPEKPASTKSLFQQITVAHEFGHMLGLPDEYMCMHTLTKDAMQNIYALTAPEMQSFSGSGNQIADVKILPDGTVQVPHIVRHQGLFLSVCHNASLVPPEFGRMTPSLMACGMVMHPHHFTTVWEAVCAATGYQDWQIKIGAA
jgi:hypothetical protein